MGPKDVFTFPRGQQVRGEDIVEPRQDGRKIVILGDTCATELIERISMDADVVVHEATNAWIREFDQTKYR
jgi:ribonuclease BN (tRNA processing enzyme)